MQNGRGLPATTRSLYRAIQDGAIWTPEYHRAFLQETGERDAQTGTDTKPEIEAEAIVNALLGRAFDDYGGRLQVDHRGLRITGARIIGELNLTAIRFEWPIWLTKCKFDLPITLTDARLGRVVLDGSSFPSMDAENVRIDGDFSLCGLDAVHIGLRGARITGLLDLQGAKLNAANQELGGLGAIYCNSAIIDGSVFMRDNFSAQGEVNFVGATIGGSLECYDGAFSNPHGGALDCNGATIKESVFLRNGSKVQGEVNFVGATIGGALDCSEGAFSNPGGMALNCNGATIKRSAFLRNGCSVEGHVNFVGATVGGDLDCIDGAFSNLEGVALQCSGITVDETVFLSDGFRAKGEVSFVAATIGSVLECSGGVFFNPDGVALDFSNASIDGSAYMRADFRAKGEVSLISATIKGSLQFWNARLDGGSGIALDLDGATIGDTLLLARLTSDGEAPPAGRIILRDVRAHLLADDGSAWKGKSRKGELILDGLTYERFTDIFDTPIKRNTDWRFRRDWIESQPKHYLKKDFRPQPWGQCARVLRAMGHLKDANRLLHQREKRWLRSGNQGRVAGLFGALMNIAIGHGYMTWRALVWLFALWGAGVFIFDGADASGQLAPRNDAPAFNTYVYSLDVLLPVINLGQDSAFVIQFPQAEGATGTASTAAGGLGARTPAPLRNALDAFPDVSATPFAAMWRWIQILLGWALSAIAIASLAGLVRRKDAIE